MRTKVSHFLTITFCLSLLAACGESGEGPPLMLTCESLFTGAALCAMPDFDVRAKLEGCAGDPIAGGCHAGANRVPGMELDLTDPAATVQGELSALIDMTATNGDYLIDSSDVNCSYVLRKLTANPGIGSRMPPPQSTEPVWSNDEIECFRAYLQQDMGL